MYRKLLLLLALILIVTLTAGCSKRSDVDREELKAVVARDAAFTDGEIPRELVNAVKDVKTVVLGEYHDISGHQEFAAALAAALHEYGFRRILLEFPHATSWILDGAGLGHFSNLPDGIERTYGVLLSEVSRINSELPETETIHVYGFDINTGNDFVSNLAGLSRQIGRPETLETFIDAVREGADYSKEFSRLKEDVESQRSNYSAVWGEKAYRVVSEMIWGESLSLTVSGRQGSTRRAREREEVIKQIVDRYLAESEGGVIINTGFYHAQKEHAFGTRQQWLGGYLADTKSGAGGSTYSLVTVPARGEMRVKMKIQSFDLADTSPENELFIIMDNMADAGIVFLSLDDELFANKRVMVNYHNDLVSHAPKKYFDGFVLLREEVSFIGWRGEGE